MIDDRSSSEQMPQTIGRYQVKECIGYGAMGAVYKAFDPLIKRTLAIKTIRLDIPRQSPQYKSFIERFYHEARISGTLSHPNIVTLFDIGEEHGIPYLAMEFVEGQTLSALTDKGVRFKPELVIGLVSQVASAIDYAHRMGVIHRDIKPSNLILFDEERVKVTDFGIAKLVDTEMTQSGTLLGTPSYMSPEQAMGEKVDGRSDIFSLGVCAFEMLSGEQPFPGNNVTAILYKLAHVEPVEPANLEMNGLVPQKWHEVFGKVLAKRADDRYQTAADFVRDLEYCLGAWFGSAMGDETIAEGSPLVAALGLPPAATSTLLPLPSAAAAGDGDLVTVDLKPKPPSDSATQPMKRGRLEPPPVSSPDRTVMLPVSAPAAAPAPPAAEPLPTVMMMMPLPEAPAAAPAPPAAEPLPTVMMMMPLPEAVPGLPPDQGAGKTVVMDVAALAPVRRVPPKAAPAALPAEPSKPTSTPPATVLMSAIAPGAASASATIVMPGTRKMSEAAVRAAIATPPATAQPLPAQPAPGPSVAEAEAEPEPAPEEPPRKGAPTALIASVLALLFVGAVGVGLLLYLKNRWSGPSPSPTPQASPSVQASATPEAVPTPTVPATVLGTLVVESAPAGASVTVNGEARGVTPLTLPDLALGEYEIKVESRGYQAFTQKVTLADAQPMPVMATLTRNAPSLATLDVLSTPFGAAVSVDGTNIGQTPISGHKLKPGSHRIEVQRHGFEPWSETVKLAAGQSQRVDATLKALAPPTTQPAPRDVVDPNRVYQVNEVDAPPKKLSGASVAYPSSAPRLKSGDSVSVRVAFVVTQSGEVADVKVLESGGKLLDEAVTATVRSWKYTPGQKRGTGVKVQLQLKQTFQAG